MNRYKPQEEQSLGLSDLLSFRQSRFALIELNLNDIGIAYNKCLYSGSSKQNLSSNLCNDLLSLEKTKLDKIARRMKPGNIYMETWLGKTESLKKILACDSEYVYKKGYDHLGLGNFLQYFCRVSNWVLSNQDKFDRLGHPEAYVFNNYTFDYRRYPMKNKVFDPVTGEAYFDSVNYVFNIEKGEGLIFSDLQTLMISKYGFYGGKTVEKNKRIEPAKIISLGFRP